MIVYHGSYTEIIEIDLSQTTPNKDFGRGFYVTKIIVKQKYVNDTHCGRPVCRRRAGTHPP